MATSPRNVVIKNHSAEANLFARRAFIAFIGVLILTIVLFSNVFHLEVSLYEKYQTRSNNNRIKLLPVAPNRGLIYDRNGVLLAENVPVYSLQLIPEKVKNIKQTLSQLATLLDISTDQQQDFLQSLKSARKFKAIDVVSRLSEQQVAVFSVNQHKFPGVMVNARLKRNYPFGKLTTHTLGYVARINRRDQQKLEAEDKSKNYEGTYDIGKLGLEKYYEDLLHGKVGHQEVEINSQGRIIRTLDIAPPEPGENLHLTLDIELQMVAKRALAGKRGAVVAIDPRDGGVLALYSNPSYDGNQFVHGISSKNYRKLLNNKRLPLINRTLQGYPPASTIKPFMSIIGLENQVISPKTRIWDPGWYQLKGVKTKSRDWKPGGHGWVNLERAIEQSCNVYFFDLANRLGINRITAGMEPFGFGDYTGIDLSEESKGILPSVDYKKRRYKRPWYTGETLSVGIGQSYWSVTPLQLAQAVTILVNKGKINIPHLLAATSQQQDSKTAQQAVIYEEKPPIVLKQPKHWDAVLNAMHNTVQKVGATGHSAFAGSKYDAAGKTGSAQNTSVQLGMKFDASKIKENKRPNAMFIAFAPYEKPEIVVAVAIENVSRGGGGTNAGPVARQIMDQYFGDRVIKTKIK